MRRFARSSVLLPVALAALLLAPAYAGVDDEIAALQGGDADARVAAAEALAGRGRDAAPAVAALGTALEDRNHLVRYWVAVALGRTGAAGKAALPALVAALDDVIWNVRGAAAEALGGIGIAEELAVHGLLRAMRDDEAHVRRKAGDAMHGLGTRAEPVLRRALASPDPLLRVGAAHALHVIDAREKDGLPTLREVLDDPRADVRLAAALALVEIGRGATEARAVAALHALLAEDDWALRAAAAAGIAEVASGALVGEPPPGQPQALAGAVDSLVAALADPSSPKVRRSAAEALSALARRGVRVTQATAAPRADALRDALASADVEIRLAAARALAEGGVNDAATIAALLAFLDDEQVALRVVVVQALGAAGPEIAAAFPALVQAMADRNIDVAEAAADSLGRMGERALPALPALTERLVHPEPRLRAAAARGLGGLGRQGSPAVENLIHALSDLDASVRAAAATALGAVGKGSSKASRALRGAAKKDPDESVRAAAKAAVAALRRR